MEDTDDKPVLSKAVLDLDAIGPDFPMPDFNKSALAMTTSIGASIQQVQKFSAELMINQVFKDMQQLSESIMEPYRAMQKMLATSLASELQKSLVKSLAINFQFKPLGLTPVFQVEEPVQAQIEVSDGALNVIIDRFGFFWLGGQKSARANANTSMHGRLLSWLENNKGELVTNEEIQALFRPGQAKQVMKDLKKELRQLGLRLFYERYRGQGIVYKGVIKKQ